MLEAMLIASYLMIRNERGAAAADGWLKHSIEDSISSGYSVRCPHCNYVRPSDSVCACQQQRKVGN